ncbi:MAG: LLM class flavin-dependent oxidoreductase [Candidatus Limnocylindrales bacterium]
MSADSSDVASKANEQPVSPATSLLGPLGVWAGLDALAADEALAYAARVEALGYDTLWINETTGREPFALLGALSRATSRVTLGVGIANIYARDAAAAHAGARTVSELSGGRFVLGLGISHPERVGPQRGHEYLPPLPTMRAFLDAYDVAPYTARKPEAEPPVVLAALRQGMVGLAGARTDGGFPFFVPLSYLPRARAWLDAAATAAGRPARPSLVVALPVVLTADPVAGLDVARRYATWYLSLTNYRTNLLECGFDEAELVPERAERVLHEVVVIGDAPVVRERIAALREAGVDHVALIPVGPDARVPHLPTVEALAP